MKHTRILLLITLLTAAAVGLPSLHGATITVTNTNDGGAGSLRQVLADANDGDTINFDSSLNGQTITLTGGELFVNRSVTISGPGPNDLTIDGNHASGVFHVSGGVTATIAGLSITNGSASGPNGGGIYNDHSTLTMINCTLSGNSADAPTTFGGGIFNDGFFGSATMTVNNSTLSGNFASFGGGIYNDGFFGSATLTVNNSTLSGNSATAGGGIFNSGSATMTVNNSTLSGNSAYGAGYGGGGIYNSGSATLTVNNSTLSGNSADQGFGGGIINDGRGGVATVSVSNSTVSGNSATSGGGIYNDGLFDGSSATLSVSNSTISGNSAPGDGGGIYNDGRASGSATLTIGDTILNAGASGTNIFNASGTVTSQGYNLSSDDASAYLNQTGDQNSIDPKLGLLQDNGGPTFTHELLSGSPAIDAGDPNFTPPPDYDQRGAGFPRVVNGRIDIGAFEVQNAPTPTYAAQIQAPINADGTSVFSVRRGVVPVKFTLTQGGVATCDLPPATIAVTRTAGGVTGEVNESVYSGNADTGSNFRIDNCQYVYNLNSSALGIGIYRVDILIDGQVVGSATFELR